MVWDLNTTWFLLVGVLLAGYAILDGFDLGAGILHLTVKKEGHRRLVVNSIGPFWDGNEVWLITGGGALFAAFPEVYASVFSGFYTALMLLLVALILRASALEFRGKIEAPRWRSFWDVCFALGSFIAALLLGVALGNIVMGMPLTSAHEYAGGLLGLLRPFPLGMGLMVVSVFALHGGLYLLIKTEGELQEKLRRTVGALQPVYFILVLAVLAWALTLPHMLTQYTGQPLLWVFPVLVLGSLLGVFMAWRRAAYWPAFLASSAVILMLLTVFAAGLFPYILLDPVAVSHSLDIYNAASSQRTLGIMLVIALIGMPLVIAYTTIIYRVFRGKVQLDSASY